MDIRDQDNRWVNTGVWPRGAQVPRTTGSSENPLSSCKQIHAPVRRAPFLIRGQSFLIHCSIACWSRSLARRAGRCPPPHPPTGDPPRRGPNRPPQPAPPPPPPPPPPRTTPHPASAAPATHPRHDAHPGGNWTTEPRQT